MQSTNTYRILALAPGTRHLGLAVFEGGELIKFGVKTFSGKKTRRGLLRRVEWCLDGLLAAYHPDTLALEDLFYAQAERSGLLNALVSGVRRWARKNGLRIVRYLPTDVKERLCEHKRTRRALTAAIIERYAFLKPFQKASHSPRAREYWQQMFDAVGLGMLAIADVETNLAAFHSHRLSANEQPIQS